MLNRLKLFVFITSLLLTSCVTTHVETSFEDTITVVEGDGAVVLTRRDKVQTETEYDFVECIKRKLGAGNDAIKLEDEQVFIDSLFPWFEPRVAPLEVNALPDLLSKPGVTEKISQAGVRYIMWLGGSVETNDGGGSMSCDINIGCFGFAWWENGATYKASIWDLETLESAGVVSADVTGRSYLPAIVIPIPLLAPTRSTACNQMAEQLRNLFVS